MFCCAGGAGKSRCRTIPARVARAKVVERTSTSPADPTLGALHHGGLSAVHRRSAGLAVGICPSVSDRRPAYGDLMCIEVASTERGFQGLRGPERLGLTMRPEIVRHHWLGLRLCAPAAGGQRTLPLIGVRRKCGEFDRGAGPAERQRHQGFRDGERQSFLRLYFEKLAPREDAR